MYKNNLSYHTHQQQYKTELFNAINKISLWKAIPIKKHGIVSAMLSICTQTWWIYGGAITLWGPDNGRIN